MRRLALALAGIGLLALTTGCCCGRSSSCGSPCSPCGGGGVYGAAYAAPAPVAYQAMPAMAASPGCGCNAPY